MTAKKLAKMSEEERAAYLEQQRLEEEETKRKKEEMLNRFLKDKLSKEEQSTKLNMLKIKEQWRNIMRKGMDTKRKSEFYMVLHLYREARRAKERLPSHEGNI